MDAIDRQAAIDAATYGNPQTAWQRIEALPSVQPERKKGKWNCSDDMYESGICSVCEWDTGEPYVNCKKWFKYCPNCGADMRGET